MISGDLWITILKLASVPLLVILNGFFVAAEFALVKVRDTQLETLVSTGFRRARVARRIVRNLDAVLSATQLGITLASLGLGWVGKPVFATLLSPLIRYFDIEPSLADWLAFAVGFTIITFLHIVVGELAPKSLAIQKPLPTSLWVAQPLRWFYKLFYPAIWLLNHAAFWLLRRCGLQPVSDSELVHSEEEIRLILGQSRRYARSPSLGKDIALNAFSLRQHRVREVMTPRHEIVALNTEDTIQECVALARETRYSRYPLCEEGDLDKTLGVVHVKDLLDLQHKARGGRDLEAVARQIIFVPERARLERVLSLFLQCKLHLAMVVDEFGHTFGLLTLENVLEELVGPIEDEFRHEETRIRRTGKETWEINGSLRVRELCELIGQPLKDTSASTVSGLVIQNLGRFARLGDVFTIDGSQLRVEEIKGTRITKIKLTRQPAATRAASGKSDSLAIAPDLRQAGPATARSDRSRMEHAA
jgi:CBS domain containing-hemolysin-like protein